MKYFVLLCSPKGRIDINLFWMLLLSNFGLATITIVIQTYFFPSLILVQEGMLLFTFLLIILYSLICITIKRYHDLNKPGWYGILVLLIPIFGFFVWIKDCGFTKGSSSPNNYGSPN